MTGEWIKSTRPNDRAVPCEVCKQNILPGDGNYLWRSNPNGKGYQRVHAACLEAPLGNVPDYDALIYDELVIIRELLEKRTVPVPLEAKP